MTEWKNILIHDNQIVYETGSAMLIKCPNNSEYKGYKYWHPSKCIHYTKRDNILSLGYTDEFVFHLKKYGNGKYNQREIINEIDLDVEEFEEMYKVGDDEDE